MNQNQIHILDTTLREGEQTPGVYFDSHIKLAIAEMLEEIGVDIIEAGHPAVTEEIRSSVCNIAARPFTAQVGAHARSLRKDVDLALECGVSFLGIFYCVSDSRLEHHGTNLDRATQQIGDVIAYAREKKPGLQIRYTPEDAVRSPYSNVLTAALTAVKAGADIISLADTTGFLVPGSSNNMFDLVSRLRKDLDSRGLHCKIALHCHNDRGLALANALDGIRAGAGIVDASVLGLGERAGIVDLASLLAILSEQPENLGRWKLELLPELYEMVSRYAGIPIPVHQPVTGRNAFTHCAGVHTQAAIANPVHYQSLDPARFGRNVDICLDHMSGLAALNYSLEKAGLVRRSSRELLDLLNYIKSIGMKGRTVDSSELVKIVSFFDRQIA